MFNLTKAGPRTGEWGQEQRGWDLQKEGGKPNPTHIHLWERRQCDQRPVRTGYPVLPLAQDSDHPCPGGQALAPVTSLAVWGARWGEKLWAARKKDQTNWETPCCEILPGSRANKAGRKAGNL